MKYLIFQLGESNQISQAGSATADNVPAALTAFYRSNKISADDRPRYFARREGSAEAQAWTHANRRPRYNTRPRFTVTLSGPELRALEQAARVAAETTDKERLAVYALRAANKLQAATAA